MGEQIPHELHVQAAPLQTGVSIGVRLPESSSPGSGYRTLNTSAACFFPRFLLRMWRGLTGGTFPAYLSSGIRRWFGSGGFAARRHGVAECIPMDSSSVRFCAKKICKAITGCRSRSGASIRGRTKSWPIVDRSQGAGVRGQESGVSTPDFIVLRTSFIATHASPPTAYRLPPTMGRLHLGGAPGRHRHHRHLDRLAAASHSIGPRSGAPHAVLRQFEKPWVSLQRLCEHTRSFFLREKWTMVEPAGDACSTDEYSNWALEILPYIDEMPLFRLYHFDKPNDDATNLPVLQAPCMLQVCPSDPNPPSLQVPEVIGGSTTYMTGSYRGVAGRGWYVQANPAEAYWDSPKAAAADRMSVSDRGALPVVVTCGWANWWRKS